MNPSTLKPSGVAVPLKPSDIALALRICIKARRPVIVWGQPGVSKSSVSSQVAALLGRKYRDIRGPQIDALDLRGIPSAENGITRYNPPSFLPTAADGPSLINFDELNRSPQMVMNALLQLILDRKLGEYTLPDTCEMIACCNRVSDGGGVGKMPAALSNRFVHLHMVPDLDDWCRWAFSAGIEPAVIAFLRFRPDLLHQFSRDEESFPTPRSWEFVSSITTEKPGNGIELALYAGAVGHGAAIEYSAFLRLFRELPNIEAILLNPDKAALPTQPATKFAVSAALAQRADQSNFARVLQYMARIEPEYAVYCVKDSVRRDATLVHCPEFTQWHLANADVGVI